MSTPARSAPWFIADVQHVINLFVAQTASAQRHPAKTETIQGFNIRRWSERGLNYWAVSDLAADELAEFGEKFEAASFAGSDAECALVRKKRRRAACV
jgi:anti-sigma factor RsiW